MQTSTETFETQASPLTTGLEANLATPMELDSRSGNFLSRTLNAAHSTFSNAVEFVGDTAEGIYTKFDKLPVHSRIGLGALATLALVVGGKEAVTPGAADARPPRPSDFTAFHVAESAADKRAVLSKLKKEWQNECKEAGGKDNFYVARIGPSRRALTEEEQNDPPKFTNTIASMSCMNRSNVTVSVNGGGENPDHVYGRKTRKYKARKLYTSQAKVPVHLSTILEADTKAGVQLALRPA